MTTITAPPIGRLTRHIVPGLGLAWSLFGFVQFAGSLGATQSSLMAGGLTAEQAAVMLGYPSWMTVAFGLGVIGGVAGCALLLARRPLATPMLALSLAGYIALYVGDIVHGVFAALGAPQVIVLSLVVAIAAGLLWYSRRVFAPGDTLSR